MERVPFGRCLTWFMYGCECNGRTYTGFHTEGGCTGIPPPLPKD